MRLGISTFTFTWSIGVPGYDFPSNPMTAIGLLDKAHRLGVDVVQFADNLPLHTFNEQHLNTVIQTAKEWGITLELGTRGSSPELLLQYLDIAIRTGSSVVRTLITDADIALAERSLREVLPEYEKHQVTLAVENHGLHTTEQLIGLFRNLQSASIGCCMDTVNSFSALESPDKVIRELTPYIVNLHIKDFEIKRVDHQMGFTILGTPAGSGRLDMDLLLSELFRNGKDPNAILELWTPYAGTVEETVRKETEWCDQSIRYLKEKLPLA